MCFDLGKMVVPIENHGAHATCNGTFVVYTISLLKLQTCIHYDFGPKAMLSNAGLYFKEAFVHKISYVSIYLPDMSVDPKVGSMIPEDLSTKCSIGFMIRSDPMVKFDNKSWIPLDP